MRKTLILSLLTARFSAYFGLVFCSGTVELTVLNAGFKPTPGVCILSERLSLSLRLLAFSMYHGDEHECMGNSRRCWNREELKVPLQLLTPQLLPGFSLKRLID